MKPYMNLGGDSEVAAYEIGLGSITVQFTTGKTYLYNNQSAGAGNITSMQHLAAVGQGLNSFIGRSRPGFASKW